MVWREIFHISLARKCQFLFGLAVLLIIGMALFTPGYVMEKLVHEIQSRSVQHWALLARARISASATDWNYEQNMLNQWWSDNRKEFSLPAEVRPRLIPIYATGDVNRVTAEAILKQWAEASKWLENLAPMVSQVVEANSTVRLLRAGCEIIPTHKRGLLRYRVERWWSRVEPALCSRMPGIVNDRELLKVIKEMQQNEEKNFVSSMGYERGHVREYRGILAVRGVKEGLNFRPLVAVIDVRWPVPDNNVLLWTRLVVVLAGVLAGFLAILVFYLISQKLILAPVRKLRACAEQISGGDLSARADLSTGDEFEELSDAFNNMLGQLERSRIELETINRSLDTKLGEMALTNVALYESNKLKSEFLANVSHELRTPLTSIIGFADLLRDAASSDANIDKTRLARYAHNILVSGRGLLEIINDLLDLAKIEAGRIELHRSQFAVRDVAEALYDLTRPLFDKKEIRFEMELADDLPMMNSDSGKLRQILYNLLSNASKYTPDGGMVRMVVEMLDASQQVRLSVIDSGPGIDPDHHERIFEKFRQLDSSVTREHSGTGLGLAITRELSLMLGGNIRLESQLGEGATFVVELPVECPEVVQRSIPSLN